MKRSTIFCAVLILLTHDFSRAQELQETVHADRNSSELGLSLIQAYLASVRQVKKYDVIVNTWQTSFPTASDHTQQADYESEITSSFRIQYDEDRKAAIWISRFVDRSTGEASQPLLNTSTKSKHLTLSIIEHSKSQERSWPKPNVDVREHDSFEHALMMLNFPICTLAGIVDVPHVADAKRIDSVVTLIEERWRRSYQTRRLPDGTYKLLCELGQPPLKYRMSLDLGEKYQPTRLYGVEENNGKWSFFRETKVDYETREDLMLPILIQTEKEQKMLLRKAMPETVKMTTLENIKLTWLRVNEEIDFFDDSIVRETEAKLEALLDVDK